MEEILLTVISVIVYFFVTYGGYLATSRDEKKARIGFGIVFSFIGIVAITIIIGLLQ